MKKNKGLTRVEAIIFIVFITFVISIIFTLYDIAREYPPHEFAKAMIGNIDKGLEKYYMDQRCYPPDHENNRGNQEGTRYQYRNDILIKYLDGDTANGGSRIQYFEYDQRDVDKKNELITVSAYGNAVWYHNFNDDIPKLEEKVIDENAPLHPWTNAVFYKKFQLYTKYKKDKDPYDGEEKTKENFRWVINYK